MRLIRQSVFVDEGLKRNFAAREFSYFWKFDKNSLIWVGIFYKIEYRDKTRLTHVVSYSFFYFIVARSPYFVN